MAIQISQKTLIILIACGFVLLGTVVGIILWRVNQQARLSSEETQAADLVCTEHGSCPSSFDQEGCKGFDWAKWTITCDADCNASEGPSTTLIENDPRCMVTEPAAHCSNGVQDEDETGVDCGGSDCSPCGTTPPDDTTPGDCDSSNPADAYGCSDYDCEYTEFTFCLNDSCTCLPFSSQLSMAGGCRGSLPVACDPPAQCPTGWVDCGISNAHEEGNGCIAVGEPCTVVCTGCENPARVYRYCKPSGGGGDDDDDIPSPYCGDGDCDTGEACEPSSTSCEKQLNGATCRDNCTFCGDGILQSGEECEPGNTCTRDGETGICSNLCTCTVTPTNPNWSINKEATLDCEDEDTEEPYSIVSFSIAVTYTAGGAGTGVLDRVVDRPVDDVECDWIIEGSITPSFGRLNCVDGYVQDITWELSGNTEWSNFDDGETKNFGYRYRIEEDEFDTYRNVATAYPHDSNEISDNASVYVTCIDTGLFDTTISKVALGLFMVALGILYKYFAWEKTLMKLNWFVKDGMVRIPEIHIRFVKSIDESRAVAQRKKVSKSRSKFEKKVSSRL